MNVKLGTVWALLLVMFMLTQHVGAAATAGYVGLGGALVSLSSGADQTFGIFETPLLAPMTLTAEAPQGSITNGGVIRINLPGDWGCRLIADGDVMITGPAYGKLGAATFTDGGRSLVLPVIADFAAGDSVMIAGLKLDRLWLVPPGSGSLALDHDGDGMHDSYDLYTITVQALWAGGHFDGWDATPNNRYSGLGGPLVSLSSGTNQVFDFTARPTLADVMLLAEEPQGTITNGGTIRISVPESWACRFDSGTLPTLSSNAISKVGIPSFADDDRTLELPVTAGFNDGDVLVIAGLRLLGLRFVPPGMAPLELDYNGDGRSDVYDAYHMTVRAIWSGGFYDGWDRAELPQASDLKNRDGAVMLLR